MAEFKIDDAKKDGKLFTSLLKFSKKEFTDENIMFYFDKGNMKGVHPKYVAEKSPREINIPHKMRKDLQKFYDASDEAKYKKELVKAKAEIGKLCIGIINRFSLTEDYQYYKAEKSIAKAVKVLGIDKKNQEILIRAIARFNAKDATGAKKSLAELIKKEKMQAEIDQIMKNLKSAGLI